MKKWLILAAILAASPAWAQQSQTLDQLYLRGSTSGKAKLVAPAVAGTPTLTMPTGSGTLPSSATSPITLSAAGAIACPTCNTSAGSVTSVTASGGLSATPNPITTSGTISLGSITNHNLFVGTGAVGAPGTVTPGSIGQILASNGAADPSMQSLGAQTILTQLRIVTAAGAVTVSAATDFIVIVNKSSGAATTVNLPGSPTTGLMFVVKDGKGDSATNNITVSPAAGTIDGASTYTINVAYASATFIYNGSEWNVF